MGASALASPIACADDEQGAYGLKEGAPPRRWTERIAKHIKRVAGKHMLVIDGSDGLFQQDNGLIIPGLEITAIDIVSDHFVRSCAASCPELTLWQYPLNALQVAADYGRVRRASARRFLIALAALVSNSAKSPCSASTTGPASRSVCVIRAAPAGHLMSAGRLESDDVDRPRRALQGRRVRQLRAPNGSAETSAGT